MRVKSRVINLANSNESSPALRGGTNKGSATMPNNANGLMSQRVAMT